MLNKSLTEKIFTLIIPMLFWFSFHIAAQPFPVSAPDGKVIIVGHEGQIIKKTDFPMVEPYFEGFAVATDLNQWFFLDEQGNLAFNRKFNEALRFSEGLAPVRIDTTWGYINTDGEIVIKPQFNRAFPFSSGLACVLTGAHEDEDDTYGYIDKSGNFVIKPFLKLHDNQFFSPPTAFLDDLAAGWFTGGGEKMPVGFFDKTGKVIIQPAFGAGDSFVNGLAPAAVSVEDSPDNFGFIDKTGNFVIRPQFYMAQPFSEGLAAVCENEDEKNQTSGKWGYIKPTGEWAIPPIFVEAEPFKNGFAKVQFHESGDEGFIRKDGSIVVRTLMLDKLSPAKTVKKANVSSISASSFLPPSKSGKIDYKPENLIDGDIQTAWIEGSKSNGIGEWVKLKLAESRIIDSLIIYNGYQRKGTGKREPFTSNIRPAKIRLLLAEKSVEVTLKDQKGPQTINLGGIKSDFIKIEILSVYQTGKEDPDCGFTEIAVMVSEQ